MKDKTKIEFIEYTGAWPCLCHGQLTLKINDETYEFGWFEEYDEHHLPEFWTSGGSVQWNEDEDRIKCNPWELFWYKENYPEKINEIMTDLIECFNKNVPFGCCGGCL